MSASSSLHHGEYVFHLTKPHFGHLVLPSNPLTLNSPYLMVPLTSPPAQTLPTTCLNHHPSPHHHHQTNQARKPSHQTTKPRRHLTVQPIPPIRNIPAPPSSTGPEPLPRHPPLFPHNILRAREMTPTLWTIFVQANTIIPGDKAPDVSEVVVLVFATATVVAGVLSAVGTA